MIKLPELMACPFCKLDDTASLYFNTDVAWVVCSVCRAETGGKSTPKDAIEEWNNAH